MKPVITSRIAVVGSIWYLLGILLRVIPGAGRVAYSKSFWREFLFTGELVFAIVLFLFFLSAFIWYSQQRLKNGSLLALIASAWMILMALLSRFPNLWFSFINLMSTKFIQIADIVTYILLLIFFLLFLRKQLSQIMKLITFICIIALCWFVFMAIIHFTPEVWYTISQFREGMVILITDPLLAVSFLLFFLGESFKKSR
ncbi:MAG: hypothetical protein JXB60_07550 [Candidatus Cloacimonetes bacterium]|nr:hypothetical protein [Candidatus Cloacimonadota bacterium]